MYKKLLLPVLISLMFAMPASAQEDGVERDAGPSIPDMAMKVFRFVGGYVSAGHPVETDEMASDDWTTQTEEPATQPEQVKTEPQAQPEADAKPDAAKQSDAVVEEKAEKAPATAAPAEEQKVTPSTNEPAVSTEPKAVEQKPVEKTQEAPKVQPVVNTAQPTSAQTDSEQAVPEKKGRHRRHHKKQKAEQAQTVAKEKAPAPFPEIKVSTYQDTLPADLTPEELQAKALAGNPEAQYRLGMASYNGKEFIKNDDKAFQWWEASANQGYLKAQHIMGVAYRRGIGTLKNAEKALGWFTKAAQQGSAIDQYIVADVYYEGKVNNVKDIPLAMYWAIHAAEQGHPGALVLLAEAKLEGKGMLPNIIHAYVLAKKAAEFDSHADGVVEDVEKAMTDEQLKIAETVTVADALKPVSLTSLMIQKSLEAKAAHPADAKAPETAPESTKTNSQEESTDND